MKLLFCTFYRWARKFDFWGTPHLSAMYLLGLLLTFNLITVIEYSKILTGSPNAPLSFNKVFVGILVLVSSFMIYLVFVRNKKYEAISKEYESSENYNLSRDNFITILYITLTILLLFSLGFFKIK